MEPMDTETLSMVNLPMEIFYHIFLYLPTLELMRCRSVCSVWRSVVDAITRCDEFWRRRCVRDHPSVYKQARTKCPDLNWRNLYRSLHLWPKFKEAKETWTDLFSSGQRKIANTYLYKESLVIHSANQIFYYDKDITTLKKRIQIGQHEFFREKDHVACYLSYSDPDNWTPMTDLNIVPKIKDELLLDNKVTVHDVYNYEIIGKDVYYDKNIRDTHKIFVAKCSDNYNSTELISAPLPIWGLSYNEDYLYVMLGGYNIYKMVNNILEHVKDECNIFGTLKYGFRSDVSLKSEIDFEDRFYLALLMGVNYTLSCMISYNKFIFTGSDKGLLHVYDADDLGKDVKSQPLVEYNIAEIFDVEEDLSISSIDVLERENGHTVYVSTVKKIVKLDLIH